MKEGSKRLITGCVWSAIGGAVVAMILGFGWGGWVTGGTAKQMANDSASVARTAERTPRCVERAKAPAEVKKLAEFKGMTSSYEQGDAVATAGWATFAGSSEADRNVATACAAELLKPAGKQAAGK